MANFDFLKDKPEFSVFSEKAIAAEYSYAVSPVLCALNCRKALEGIIEYIYAYEKISKPYNAALKALVMDYEMRRLIPSELHQQLIVIINTGNTAAHTNKIITNQETMLCLDILFRLVELVDCWYGHKYTPRKFDEAAIPPAPGSEEKATLKREIEEARAEADAKSEENKKLLEEISKLKSPRTENESNRPQPAMNISEYKTRQIYIDSRLRALGWEFEGPNKNVIKEYHVANMNEVLGQSGRADYVLLGKDGRPLAVIEAKRTSKNDQEGRKQAELYAQAIYAMTGQLPVIFLTNGFTTNFIDETGAAPRPVGDFFSRADLERIIDRRNTPKELDNIEINDNICSRYYQKDAIQAVCREVKLRERKHLLVMATGTGKTRTAAGIADVLSRGGYVTNILFLADRTALVRQAKEAFNTYLPDFSLCNLCTNKDDRNARVVFSTYPTMMNAIDYGTTEDGMPLFTPGHFDLIIVDEAHRSIFKKYRAIFDYFDARLLGLTATPKSDIDHNTYEFFGKVDNDPTYVYEYQTAIADNCLVPYYSKAVKTLFMNQGIKYDDLSEEDKERFDEDFGEAGVDTPSFIPPNEIMKTVLSVDTIDKVLETLMEEGIRVEHGERIGKTIIFAQNTRHARLIEERFNALYPQFGGDFARCIVCEDNYSEVLLDDFKNPEKLPQIGISVDMLDTGVDVRECVNLVMFKQVKSRTKFWQMLGRGTRVCPELSCQDRIDGDYDGKRRFMLFDWCNNIEFFNLKPQGAPESENTETLTERIFKKQTQIIFALQDADFAADEYAAIRKSCVESVNARIRELNPELYSVRRVLQSVETFKDPAAFTCLSVEDVGKLQRDLAPIVCNPDTDTNAKLFDDLMYGLFLARVNATPDYTGRVRQVRSRAAKLLTKATIPAVKENLELLKTIREEDYWKNVEAVEIETLRLKLRDLMQYLDPDSRPYVKTTVTDRPLSVREGGEVPEPYDFEAYYERVEKYFKKHADEGPAYKLRNNIPVNTDDYNRLERILTGELGDKNDYESTFGTKPYGAVVRAITKLNHDAVERAFTNVIAFEKLNPKQQAYMKKIMDHMEKNGYTETSAFLMNPPFNNPMPVTKMFDSETQARIAQVIRDINNNARA